jgi:GTPase SAR1 family protein
VYAITDDTTFGKLDRVREEILKAQGRPVPIYLVGTKADLASDRAVSEKERAAKARAWGCKSVEVSAKTNVGIDEAFTAIITDVLTGDATKGSGGGSVLGAGRTPSSELHSALPPKKKACAFL